MTFYIVTFVGRVDDTGRPVTDPLGGRPTVREVQVWDDRDVRNMTDDYRAEGVLHLQRVGTHHSPGRPLEHKGPLAILAPHLISVTKDVKAAVKQPEGPVPFTPSPRK